MRPAAFSSTDDPALIGATARAVVAITLVRGREGRSVRVLTRLYLIDERTRLVSQVAESPIEGQQGVRGLVVETSPSNSLRPLPRRVGKSRRVGLMTAASPGVGDILLYQRRGAQILGLLQSEIAKYPQESVFFSDRTQPGRNFPGRSAVLRGEGLPTSRA